MVGSMLHCFPTSVYFQLIAVTISSVLSPWIHDGIYSFTQWSTCFHLSAILYGPANVHDFSRGKCLWTNHMNDMANGTFVNFSEIASLKFELKKKLGMFSFKKSNTLSSMQCEVTDRWMQDRTEKHRPSWSHDLTYKIIIITADHFMHLGNPNICKRGNTYS